MTQKALNMLGICARAGALKSGEQICEQLLKRGTACLAIMDVGASEAAKKNIKNACQMHNITLLFAPDGALGHAIGKPGRMAVVVMDGGFAKRIIELCQMTEN